MSEKIRPGHLSRKAMLYVRQSSPNQVMRNKESRLLQYGMRKRLLDLGWREIDVVDEDLGKSAEGHIERTGFERMVAEVCLGKVGVVGARELSRYARNSREWQHLIEVCRVIDTLLVDHETVYDPRRGNDRLLLGLKGSLNEYELDILRLRSVEARREKARRGELIILAPVGYVKTSDGRLEKDPDVRVQEVVTLIFRKTLELGAARQVLLWFIEHDIDIPVRRFGPLGWETVWKRPTHGALTRLLADPSYAGFYAYGRTETIVELVDGRAVKKTRRRPKERWLALIPDHHEGYIGRVEFERVREMMENNSLRRRGSSPGAAKRGPALLAGLVRCRRCGRKLTTNYSGAPRLTARYCCVRGLDDHAEPRCISINARDADEAVSREAMSVVEPAAVEAAHVAARNAAAMQDDAVRVLELELEAAQYAAEKAFKQYDAADPENRLVAAELERRWNAALERARKIEERVQEDKAKLAAMAPPPLEVFKDLARDLDRVWGDPATDVRLKKRILRTLIKGVVVDIDRAAGKVELVVHWKGGVHTELRVRRRRHGENRYTGPIETVEAVRILALLCPDEMIAGYLNRNGLRTGRGNRWTRGLVASFRNRKKIPCYSAAKRRAEGWMCLREAAAHLGLSPRPLRRAAVAGEVESLHPLADGPWIFKQEDIRKPGALAMIERVKQNRKGGAVQAPGQLSLLGSGT